jgi:hypothetical protein
VSRDALPEFTLRTAIAFETLCKDAVECGDIILRCQNYLRP